MRRIQNELFTNEPSGMPGNDDAGSTSSWSVFSTLGLYPIYPGVGGFVVGSPAFTSMTVRLKSGALKILAPNADPTKPYVQGLKIDGVATTSLWTAPGDAPPRP
jgi:putative alpha-1,2-mannosidase